MTRRGGWDVRLAELLHARAQTPMRYGSNDCCLLAADAIAAMTGTDIAEEFRGYRTEVGAARRIRRVTGAVGVEAALRYCAAKHELPGLASVYLAQRGDLLLLDGGAGLIAGIVGTHGACVTTGEHGLRRLPLASAVRAWRV